MTVQAANARLAAAIEAEARGDFAAAARDFTLAAEQFVGVWWAMHRNTNSPDAANARRDAVRCIRLRDAGD